MLLYKVFNYCQEAMRFFASLFQKLSNAVVFKVFHTPSLQTQTLSIPPQQKSQKRIAKISRYLLWRNNRRL